MKSASLLLGLLFAWIANAMALAEPPLLDMEAAAAEVSSKYGKAHPEVQEFVLHTAARLDEAACGSMRMPMPD